MGADLIIQTIPVRTGQDLDFDAGRAWVRAVDVMEKIGEQELDMVFGLTENESLTTEDALALIDEFEHSLDSREVTTVTVGPYTIYITGGMSWGDSPTDACVVWDKIVAIEGLPEAMGVALNG